MKNLQYKNLNNSFLASYMAGFFEGDGSVFFRKNDKGLYSRVNIKFAFSKDDKTYAEFLRNLFNIGYIYEYNNKNAVEWIIFDAEEIFNFLIFISDHLRTPKILDINNIFHYYKMKYNITPPIIRLNSTHFFNDAWFSGFSEADSSFQIGLSKEKINTTIIKIYYQLPWFFRW